MWKKLIWKEWRQNKAALYLALLSFFVLLWGYWLLIYLTEDITAIYQDIQLRIRLERTLRGGAYYFLCSFFACLVAASSFAEERSKKTMEFLLSQPIKCTSIWATKTVIGLALVTLIFLLYNIFHRLLFAWMGVVRPDSELPPYLPYSLYLIFLCYAVTLLFSTLLDNTTIMVLAGGMAVWLLFLGIGFLDRAYSLQLDWKDTFWFLLPMSVVFILLSYFIFCGVEINSMQRHKRNREV